MANSSTSNIALIVGVTGIAGTALAEKLISENWTVYGISRNLPRNPKVIHLKIDLNNSLAIHAALTGLKPTHVYFTTWIPKGNEADNIVANRKLVKDIFSGLEKANTLQHSALVTGLKHYMGPFESYGTKEIRDTPFHEDEERVSSPNFYYAQEDELWLAADRLNFTWSVHRSHTIIGHTTGNAMNMALTIAVAASLAKKSGSALSFPGNEVQWNGITDMTDSDLLANHMFWASVTDSAKNTPFNVSNGDVFRWRWMWPRLGEALKVDFVGPSDELALFERQMSPLESLWVNISKEYGLKNSEISNLASWWHTDGDLNRPIECFSDMNNSRIRGFLECRNTLDSFLKVFRGYQLDKIIPKY
jgi:nucleoside-diphosphate-sugar epimerase